MKIAHYGPFAPNACGLYEAAKDMYTADKLAGHEVYFVDTGITVNGERKNTPGLAGSVDKRGATELVTVTPEEALSADIIIAHSGIPDNWIVGSQSPIIWVLHGRPAACFRPEQVGHMNSYTLVSKLARWPRVRTMLSFWPYHTSFWKAIIPEDKLKCLPAPPIDGVRFNPNGKKHEFKISGDYNIIFADTQREDINIFEPIHGALEFVKSSTKSVVFHFYGMPVDLGPWEVILLELKKQNALGDVWHRKTEMEDVLRAADLLISPHRITTRIIGEALSCGTPVIANGCEFATWNCNTMEPSNVAATIEKAIADIEAPVSSDVFALSNYSKSMESIYAHL